MKRRLMIIGFFLVTLSSESQEVLSVSSPDEIVNLAPEAFFLEDPGGTLTLEQVQQPKLAARFQRAGTRIINFGITASYFWLRLPLQNNTENRLMLEMGNYALTDIFVYETSGGRLVKQHHTGNWQAFAQRLVKNTKYLFPLTVGMGQEAAVYIRVMHFRGTQFSLKAGTVKAFYEKDIRRNLLEGMYYGFMLVMILYNLFIYFSLRDEAYLLYVFYVFFMALLNATINGYAFQYVWPSLPIFNRYDDVIASFAGSAGVLFAAKFLDTQKNAPVFHKVFLLLLLVYLLSVILIASSNFQAGLLVIELNTLVLVASFFMAAWITYRKGYKPARFFLLAWSFLLVSVFVFILNNFNIVPSSTYATHSLQIGSAVEALLLSFALANRINIYKDEKRKAQLAMLHSLEKNKELIEEQKSMLEKKVAERTNELKRTNDELLLTVQNLRETQAQLIQREKMASLGELTAGIAHEIQNPLNFVNNFSEVSTELVDEIKNGLEAGQHQAVGDTTDALKENLQKILYHGKRAESIVRGMLRHSHMPGGHRVDADLNNIVEDSLRLSFHGMRASDKNFNAIIETNFDTNVGTLRVVPQDISRVLLNIFNNAFYSLRQKKKMAPSEFQPEIFVSTKRLNGKAIISVRDNGMGISAKVKSKIYQPFFTTKPSGEGTGLGLSLSYDIVTKEHGGTLYVNTEEGEFAEFVIQLPVQQG